MLIYTQSCTFLLDADSPSGLYMRIRNTFPQTILFESNDSTHDMSGKSIIVIQPIDEFCCYKPSDGEFKKSLSAFISKFKVHQIAGNTNSINPDSSVNGIFGYCCYDIIQGIEEIRFAERQALSTLDKIPSAYYALFKYVLTFDHRRQIVTVTVNSNDKDNNFDEDINRIKSIAQSALPQNIPFKAVDEIQSAVSDDEFIEFVNKCKQYIQRGDVFQMVPSRRFYQKYIGDEFQVYRALRTINPSPYLFFLDLHKFKIFGSSPETFLTVHNNIACLNPIAGTIKNNTDKELLESQINALLEDKKENAEHVMLVDLARNDLSKSCFPVQVKSYKQIKSYSHVVHLVSEVIGTIAENKSALDIFCDCFPAGTVSGAPKYKAMQLIDQLEPVNRSFYAGAIGFFGFDNSCVHALTIRSALATDNILHLQAGAGVVCDSVPEKENEEIKSKIQALVSAINYACEGI